MMLHAKKDNEFRHVCQRSEKCVEHLAGVAIKRKKASFHLAFTLWLSNGFQSVIMSYNNHSPSVGVPKDSSYQSYLFYLPTQMCGNFIF